MKKQKIMGVLVVLGSFYFWQSAGAITISPTRLVAPRPTASSTVSTPTTVIVPIKIEPTIVNKEEINKLDPQPEPPAPLINSVDRLDPQPEPPMGQVSTQEREEVRLNSPLIGEVKEFRLENTGEEKFEPKKIMLFESSSSTGNQIEILPSANSLMARFEHNKNQINIPVRTNFQVEAGKMVLGDGTATYTLKMQLPAFYASLNTAIEKIGLNTSSLSNVELTIQDHKPMYNAIIEEKGKLFGLVPFKIKNRVQISDDGSEVKTVRPWYAKLMSGLVDIDKIKFAPNITVTKLETDPAFFQEGNQVKIKATLENTGNAFALSVPGFSGPGSTLTFFANNEYVGGYAVPIMLGPGETVTYDYVWKNTKCNAPLRVEFSTAKIDEANKTDNILTAVANCGE